MISMKRHQQIAATSAVFILWATGGAWAYLDPGTGSIIIQSLIGGIAAATALIGIYWNIAKSFVGRLMGKPNPTDPEAKD